MGLKPHHHNPKIAIATEGKAEEVSIWVDMMSKMEHKSHVTLFLLSYDKPLEAEYCVNQTRVICMYKPGSTWTSGRNELSRAIDSHESSIRHRFKYWLFGDQDMVKLDNCGEATRCQGDSFPPRSSALAACCFDVAMQTLTAPEVQYAVVNFNIWGGGELVDYLGFSHMDCCDASLSAFHRVAVPVVLPYIELVDKISWWEAQGLHFHVVSGCFPGYSVYHNAFSIKATSAHSPYPMGRYPGSVEKAIRQVYEKRGLVPDPLPMNPVQLEQGNCAKLDHDKLGLVKSYEPRITTVSNHSSSKLFGGKNSAPTTLKTLWVSNAWQKTASFKKCQELLKPRYLSYMKSGILVELDGEVFSK